MKIPITHRFVRAMRPRGRMAGAGLMVVIASAALASCDVHQITGPGSIASITVTPDVTLAINATQQFLAVARDAEGVEISIDPVWSVVEGGGVIGSEGMFTAGTTPGLYTATIQAASGGMSGTATVTVTVGPPAYLTVSPNPDTLEIGGTRLFTVVAHDAGGNVVAVDPVWSVVAGGGTIDADGVFTAGAAPGTYTNTVQAALGGLTGSATVTVLPPPLATITVTPNPASMQVNGTQQFTAVGRDANGDVVSIDPTWAVVNQGGQISGSGLFTAGATTGTFTNTVRAVSGDIAGVATVTVTAPTPALATITVTPNPASVQVNGTRQFTAVGRDTNGDVVSIDPTWFVVNGGGQINGSGLFTAGATTGTFTNTVRAASGGISGTATVTVTTDAPAPLATITVTPNPASVQVNGTRQFTAVGRDTNGDVVSINPTWSVVNGGGQIDGSGLFTAGGTTGTFTNTVRAASGGISGMATVNVTDDTPAPSVNLGSAATYGILAGSEVTCIAGGTINADIGIHPGLALTGFGPCSYTGEANLGNAIAEQAQVDLTTAYNTLAGMPCDNTIVADLGGTTLLPGVYCHGSGIGVTGTVTLDGNGDSNAVFVFQAGSSLTTAGNVALINGAQARNVYWQVGSSATLGTGSQWQGNILVLTSVTLNDTATLRGRALARNGAVTLGTNNTITLP